MFSIQLDQEDQSSQGHHRRAPSSGSPSFGPVRSCCSSRAEMAYLLLGSTRITTRSAGSRSATTERATYRSRRATRCLCTNCDWIRRPADPHLGATPIRVVRRRASTTMSALLAAPHPFVDWRRDSVDRVVRCTPEARARSSGRSRGRRAAALADAVRTRYAQACPGPHPAAETHAAGARRRLLG